MSQQEENIITDVVTDTVNNVVSESIGNIQIQDGIVDTKAVAQVVNELQSQIFNTCLEQLTSKGKELGLELEPNSIMTYVKLCMEIVEKTDVKGKEQKTLVVQLITKLVKDAPISDEREKLCLDVLSSGIVGDTIDLIVMASRGQLDLNSVSQTAVKRLPNLIALFTKCCKSKKK